MLKCPLLNYGSDTDEQLHHHSCLRSDNKQQKDLCHILTISLWRRIDNGSIINMYVKQSARIEYKKC